MFFRKRIRISAFQIENADESIPEQQRNHEFRAHDHIGFHLHEARIVQCVGDANRAAFARRSSGDSVMQRKAKARRNRVAVAQTENAFEKLRVFVPQHHAEKMIVNDFFDALRDATQQFFAIENGREFATDVVQQRERACRFRHGQNQVRGYRISVFPERECSEFGRIVHTKVYVSLTTLYLLDV